MGSDLCTKTIDPEQTTRGFPLSKNVTLSKPLGGATVMRLTSNVVIRPWIRRRQPTPNVVLQLVACQQFQLLYSEIQILGVGPRTFRFIYLQDYLLHKD